MATPRRTSRASSSIPDALSTVSSPDPLNASFESAPWPSARRQTRSVTKSLTRNFMSLGKSTSPRKQTFALDIGSSKTPSKLFVTVETENSELMSAGAGEDYEDVKRTLFPTPTPKRKRSDTTTTSIPLRDEDTNTPKRRGRPRRQQTPRKQTPGGKRARLSADAEEVPNTTTTKSTPKSTRTRKAASTPHTRATPGRKRKAAFVPEETITWATVSPPKRLRQTPSPGPDDAFADNSPASSGFHNEPAEDTVAQEDFSPIFAYSLNSMRASIQEQETQELGEATSLIIENALEELRQSRGEAAERFENPALTEDLTSQAAGESEAPANSTSQEAQPTEHSEVLAEVPRELSPEAGQDEVSDMHAEASSEDEQVVDNGEADIGMPIEPEEASYHSEHKEDVEQMEATQQSDLVEEASEAANLSPPRAFALNYADFSSSVATKRRSSPQAALSPLRAAGSPGVYDDSFSEIPQEILDAAAPSGTWPPEARLNGSPIPVLTPRGASVDLGARPPLSPIVRAGRALQSVTSDDASPHSRQNSLGSPFKPNVASTPVQKATSPPKLATEDITPQEPQSAASKKSWISNIVEAGVKWFSPSQTSPRSTAVEHDAADDRPSFGSERPAPTEDSVFKPRSHGSSLQATVEDEEDDIWAIEAQRDTNGSVGGSTPNQLSPKPSLADNRHDTSDPVRYQFSHGSRKHALASKLSSKKRPFASKSNIFRRSTAPIPWKPSSVIMSSDPADAPESELSEYSLLASGKKTASGKRFATHQVNERSLKRRKDLDEFFSSPALLPGAENAQSVLERKRLELAPKVSAEPAPQPYRIPTTTMFPSIRPPFVIANSSPVPSPVESVPEPSPVKPAKLSPFAVDLAERKRAIRQARTAFRTAMNDTKEKHKASGSQGDLPAFGVDLGSIQFPKAFKAPLGTDYETIMSREEVDKWAQETSNIESSSPYAVRHNPNKYASPTKSCLRPSTKPHTPGPRLQWGRDVLSPSAQAEKRAEKHLKQQFITDFKKVMYSNELQEELDQANKENAPSEAPSTPTREADMMDIDPPVQTHTEGSDLIAFSPVKDLTPDPARQTQESDTAAITADSVEDAATQASETKPQVEWSDDQWGYLDDLIRLRRKGQFPFEFPEDFVPQSRHLVGLTMSSHGETLRINPWHISIVDAFQATTNRQWGDEEVARRVVSLLMVEVLRKENREPKKPWRRFRRAAQKPKQSADSTPP